MRKGSTPLGSLGVILTGIVQLILPLTATAVGTTLAPVPGWAQDAESTDIAAAQRAALERRKNWLDRGFAALADRRRGPARRSVKAKVRPVKVIHTRATWYGPGFHGRRTASGERFNRHAMTLASRHLPFGTQVRVVNPKTGKSAVARVNDRGPFRGGYTADLSQGLARRIGMSTSGPVRLEILPKTASK